MNQNTQSPNLKERFNNLLGLEELQDFKLSNIFSAVFVKHTIEDMEDQLITGTARHTPSLSEIEIGWARPWLFARLFLISVVMAILLYFGYDQFQNRNMVPGLLFVGSFAVPMSTLLFFMEMNVPRNVSIFRIMQLLFLGGILSLVITLIISDGVEFLDTYLGASAAGITEEPAKMLIVVAVAYKARKSKWILNGLLFGAAVGTGFGAFESAGYAFRNILKYDIDTGVYTIMFRASLAPFMHVIWTANAAAALWLAKKDKPFSWELLQSPVFLRIFLSSVIIHMLWNSPFKIMPLPYGWDLKMVVLGLLGWIISFRLIQAGLKQLNEARQEEVQRIVQSC